MLAITWAEVVQSLGPTLVMVALAALGFVGKWLLQVRSDTGEIKNHLKTLNGTVATIKASDAQQNERLAYLEGQAGMALGSVRKANEEHPA